MFKPRLFFTIFAVLFFLYWFVLFPLLWVYLRPVIIEQGIFDSEPPFWIPSIFWCGALIIFVLLLMIVWSVRCCLRKKYTKQAENGDGQLNSFTIHNEDNKNIKDRVQPNKLKLKRKSDTEAYQDIQDVFLRPKTVKPKLNTATQTSGTFGDEIISTPFNDAMRSSGRLSSCYSCSKSITDEDMVNIFLNKLWTDDSDANDTNDVKFEVVGKSVNQAKRFHIDEIDDDCTKENSSNTTTMDDNCSNTTMEHDKLSTTPIISIPVRQSKSLKSEIFIMINVDSTSQVVDGSGNASK